MPSKRSPCTKPECIHKDKIKCSKDCKELAEFQKYLDRTHDQYSPPAIDPTERYPSSPDGYRGMSIHDI